MTDGPGSSDHHGLIRSGPARVFIGGEELNGGMDSMRWEGDKLVAEVDAKVFGSIEQPPIASIARAPENTERSGSFTITEPRPSLWTRLYCALWWGHRPVRHTLFGFITDELTCRCGKVTDSAEVVERRLRK